LLFRRNEVEIERSKLFRIYIQKYFLLDVLSSIPFGYILSLIADQSPVVKYFRLLRLLKMYRMLEISDLITQHTTVNVPLFRIKLLFVSFIIISHWFNCMILYVGKWELGQERRFDGKSLLGWLPKSSPTYMPAPEEWTPWELYFNMLVLCVCFMGSIMYGDIIPFTLAEETLSIIQMILGRVFIAFLFAEISSYVQQQYSAYDDHSHSKNMVLKWMQLNGINSVL